MSSWTGHRSWSLAPGVLRELGTRGTDRLRAPCGAPDVAEGRILPNRARAMSDPTTRLNAALEGRYRLESELGEGGMATVYLADDLRHERKVALKVLKPELAAVVGAERFLAEIKTTANLQHPHILPLFDSGEADSFLFYVMPYVEGESLRERLDREHQLPVDEAVQVAKDVAEALQAAHDQGVIHRDVKPANILLSKGRPLVSDFGIALAFGAAGAGRLTETGLSLGTPHYMSPEQATGDLSVGAATDVYALGCVLYEMLVGEPPFTGSTPQAVLGKILTRDADPVVKHRRSVPANVGAAIRRALERVPADRFATVADLRRALADPDFSHRDAVGADAPRSVARWRAFALAASVVALALASSLVWTTVGPKAGRPAARFEVSLPEGVELVGATSPGMALSPDGSQLVFRAGSGGDVQLWLRPLGGLSVVPLDGTEDAEGVSFSPDGTAVAFTRGSTLRTVSLAGAPPQLLVTDSAGLGGVAWADDGMIYFTKPRLGIWRVSDRGGEAEPVLETRAGEAGQVRLDALPEGRGLLFTSIGADMTTDVAVFSPETGEARTLLQGAQARYAHSGHLVWVTADGTLRAARFDLDRLDVSGPSRALAEGVEVGLLEFGGFTLSRTGVLAYRRRSNGGAAEWGVPVWVGRDGSQEILDPGLPGRFSGPAISPDGTRIAFVYDAGVGATDIRIYDLAQGGTLSPLTSAEGSARRPFWSPDGREVGYVAARGRPLSLYARRADFSGEERLLLPGTEGAPLSQALWTPDGSLVYRAGVGGVSDLYTAPAHPDSAATRTAIASTPFRELSPSMSPNGGWLAYESDESGLFEVYVRPFPGPGGRHSVSRNGGQTPVWANGREIVYVGADGSWIVATVRTSTGFAVESWDTIGSSEGIVHARNSQNFDVSPVDGRILAIRRAPGAAPVRDVVVLDFFEELNRLVPVE